MENNYKVRLANQNDSRRVWEIRNHPDVRAVSGNSQEFPFESHDPWFQKKYFSGADNHCFVLEATINDQEPTANGKKLVLGYCRYDYDLDHDHYIVAIALDPSYHGRGLGHMLLSESSKMLSPSKKIFAEIQRGNVPSLKLFQKNGYEIFEEDEKNYHLYYPTQ